MTLCTFQIISIPKAISFLREQGHNYSEVVLVKSEMRLLNALDFRLHNIVTVYHQMQTILELVGKF